MTKPPTPVKELSVKSSSSPSETDSVIDNTFRFIQPVVIKKKKEDPFKISKQYYFHWKQYQDFRRKKHERMTKIAPTKGATDS